MPGIDCFESEPFSGISGDGLDWATGETMAVVLAVGFMVRGLLGTFGFDWDTSEFVDFAVIGLAITPGDAASTVAGFLV